MPAEVLDQSLDLNVQESETAAVAEEYQPGELAPAIITQARVWKPQDFDGKDGADVTIMNVLKGLVETCSQADEAARRFSVLSVWEERHMDRGYQYLESGSDGGWKIVGTGGSGRNSNALATANDANLYPTNISAAQGDIITSALCRGQIKVKFTPKKSKEPMDVACADAANKYKYIWEKANDTMGLQRETMGLAWTDPRGLYWTRTVADKSQYGMVDGLDELRRVEVTSLHGVLETKLPMMVDRLSECSYAQIWCERDYAMSRAAYPWMGDKVKPSWGTYGELEFERIARINTRIGIVGKYITGTSGIRETTEGYVWFRPGMYFDGSINAQQREFLLKNFPSGVFIIMAGQEFVCCWDESMDDHLTLGMFARGFGQNRRSLGSSDVPIQKRINIWADLWDKFVRTSIASGIYDDQTYNMEAIYSLEATPGRGIPAVKPDWAQTLQDTIAQTPTSQPIQGMAEIFQWYVGPLIQSIDGATPALFGQGEGSDNTVGATQIRLQQALERIGTAWIVVNQMFAKACGQAVKCCGDNGNSEVSDSVDGLGDVTVDPSLLKGNFNCFSETINAIPESGAQREAKVMQVLDMANASPQIMSIVGKPSNAREIVKALGIDDVLSIDEANWEDSALEDIARLLDSQPRLNPAYADLQEKLAEATDIHEQAKSLALQATQTGEIEPQHIDQGQQLEEGVNQLQHQLQQTPQYLPSVPVAQDDSEDHETIADTVFAWMGDEGRAIRRKAAQETPGEGKNWAKWTNVMLYWQGHKQMAAKIAAENQQPIPPKTSINIAVDKLAGAAQSQALAKAGIQIGAQDAAGPNESTTETIQRTAMAEIKQKVKRRL